MSGYTEGGGVLPLAKAFADLASKAGARILQVVAENLETRTKADQSPVTAADEAAEALIIEEIARILPGVPVIAEESAAQSTAGTSGSFVLVDPIDGTKELIAGRGEYTVNIALIESGRPVVGVVYAPRLDELYVGSNGIALRLDVKAGAPFDAERAARIRARPRQAAPVAMISRSHPDPVSEKFLAGHAVAQTIPLGSSLKFARIAEGAADIYARLAPVNQWDIAAGDALLVAAGGSVTTPDGAPVRYGRGENGFGVKGFVAWGAPAR